MKFKLIFALFNGIVVISFLFVFLMPVFVLGLGESATFWLQNWYLVLVFAGVLLVLDSYFIVNWRLFQLLEKEDWQGLSDYLEHRIFVKKRVGSQGIRLLCNAWVVRGMPQEIKRIEVLLRQIKPRLVERHALLLGIPYLLANESAPLLAFFEPLARRRGIRDREWLRFNLAFGLLAERRSAEALPILEELAAAKATPIVSLLALYLIDSCTSGDDAAKRESLERARSDYRRRRSRQEFEGLMGRMRENLEVIILSKFIFEAADWLYGPKAGPAPAGSEAAE